MLKSGEGGEIVRLSDVAALELGAGDYTLRSQLDDKNAVAIGIFQAPGANALEIQDAVIAQMDEMAKRFPAGIKYESVYDTTIFVRDSIKAVVTTLLEAVLLVVLVVILFLQTWRASIIPLIAVPVSIVGTFAALYLLGFSINTLSLFGLVLAIGIVVDDAIVVVENVERNIEEGLAPLAAAHQAMKEVSGPIIAIALVLCAVFVPMAFLSGVTGQFYKQFAVTIAISTVISAINSLTLSPALAARLLKPHGAPKDAPSRLIDRLFGWVFRPFNRFFKRSSDKYQGAVSRTLGRRGAVFAVYAVLLVATGLMFKAVPAGFIPTQDKLYLIAGVKLPEGASLARTDAVLKKVSDIAMNTEGVAHSVAFPGLNALQFTNTPNTGVAFFPLKPFSERNRSAAEINAEINQKIAGLQEGFTFSFMPPPILGLGNGVGLPDVHRGSRQPRLRRAAERGQRDAGRGDADAGHGLPDQQLPGQRAAARRRGRPRQGQGAGRAADRAVRHAADLPGLGLRQRLQPVRPHLAGDRAGRRLVPRQRRGHRQPAYAQRPRRDGADRLDGEDRPDLRPGSGAALQRLSGRRPGRRSRSAHAVLGAGDGHADARSRPRCCPTA